MTPRAQSAAKSASASNNVMSTVRAFKRSVSDRARPISTTDPAVEPTSPVAPAKSVKCVHSHVIDEFV